MSLPSLADDAKRLCQQLLRIDTTNPPGNERPAAELVAGALREVGFEPELLDSAPTRTNVVVRHRGTGKKPPLLLTAHLDVVEADASKWEVPPFSGKEHDGCLWGRGAIDMKNMAAMCTAILRRLAADNVKLDRDIIFAAVADEEAGCDLGSRFLVENHRSKVEAEYAIGESGGFSLHLGDTTFYPIQVAEKGFCWVKARITGEPGHGSMPRRDSVITKLGESLAKLGGAAMPFADQPAKLFGKRLPFHCPIMLIHLQQLPQQMREAILIVLGHHGSVDAPEVADQCSVECLGEELLQRWGSPALVDRVITAARIGEAPEPVGLPVHPPAGLIGMEHRGGQCLLRDLLIPGK